MSAPEPRAARDDHDAPMSPVARDAAAERPELLAADAERERIVESLRAHAGAGRLDAEELEERIGTALHARTVGDLAALVADLPEPRRTTGPAPRAHGRRHHRKDPLAFLPIALLLVAIWAVTGAGYFWPMWPLLWFAFAGLMSARPGNTRVIR